MGHPLFPFPDADGLRRRDCDIGCILETGASDPTVECQSLERAIEVFSIAICKDVCASQCAQPSRVLVWELQSREIVIDGEG
jgi:hypothetical protein